MRNQNQKMMNCAGGDATETTVRQSPLNVVGNRLLDADGRYVTLRGVSLIDIGANGNAERAIQILTNRSEPDDDVEGWAVNTVRLPIYPPDVDGHRSRHPFPPDPDGRIRYVETILDPLVDIAVAAGLYVVIDFHQIANVVGNGALISEANDFWRFMAPRYADHPQIIYEVYNEPINENWQISSGDRWREFLPVVSGWVEIIRRSAAQNLILVGSTTWSQDIAGAALDPVPGNNIAYVAHVYPYNYTTNNLFEQIETCAKVHPVVLTEWGYGAPGESDAMFVDDAFPEKVRELVNQNHLNWIAWCFDDVWGPPMFHDAALTRPNTFGKFVKQWLYLYRNC